MSAWNIRPLMSSAPPSINPKDSLRRARALMRTAKVEELFVLDDGKLIGIVSAEDLLWAFVENRRGEEFEE